MKDPEHFPARPLDRHAPVRDLLPERPGPFNVGPYVYRFYSADQLSLYIGMTHGSPNRWDRHRRASAWWSLVEYVAVSFYGTHEEAMTAELAAIRAERPAHNRQGLVPRKQLLIKFEDGAESIAAELHQIADPDLVRQLAELLAAPHLFPGPTPPPAPTFPARE